MMTHIKHSLPRVATVFTTASTFIRTALLGCACFVHLPAISGQELSNGALLLKETDRVMTGKISERGEFYEVEIGPDSRVSIPKQSVAQVAGSLDELYQTKRRAISQWSVGDHYQLSRWCMLNNLLAQAAEHYTETAQRSPDHPRVRQLGVALQERMLQDESFRRYLGLDPITAQTDAAHTASYNRPTAPAEQQAATPAVVTTNTSGAGVTEMNGSAHPEIIRRFTERVQPILLNRCSQTACHGAQSRSTLRLTSPYASAASRITSENFASVLKQVSPNANLASPLVHFATNAHGIQPAPAIGLTERKLIQELENWIAFVRNPVVSAVATHATTLGSQVRTAEQFKLEPYPTAVTLIPVDPGARQLRSVPRDSLADPQNAATVPFPMSAFPVGSQAPSAAEIEALDAQLRATLGELPAETSTSPMDPFDPAEFNRRIR